MKLRDILTEDAEEIVFQPKVGAQVVQIKYVPEHEDLLKERGFKPPFGSVGVVYAHELNFGENDTMDMLKSRKKYSGDNKLHRMKIGRIIDRAVQAVIGANPEVKYKHEGTREAIRLLQQYMANATKKNVIIVPAPSSSTFSSTIARRLALKTGAKVMDVLEKETHPPVSMRKLQRDHPDMDHSTVKDPSTFKSKMEAAQSQMEKAYGANNEEQFAHWEREFEEARKDYENYVYKRKSYQYPHNAHVGRAIYNTIKAKPEAAQLQDAYVIIVDDNVINGTTIGEIVKTLMVQGIVPKGIVGFVPHRFVSSRT